MASILPPQTHSQPSRKGKKAWRKNVDLTEIQSGLEDVREQIIQGGIVTEKPSSDLFTLDTTGSSTIQQAYLKKHKPLKADEILSQRSAIPALEPTRKRSASRTTDGLVQPHAKKRRSGGGVSHKEYDRLRSIAYGGDAAHKDVVSAEGAPSHDPWAPVEAVQDPRFSFLEAAKPVRAPGTLKHAPVSLMANGKAVPAVRLPEPGKSYNPVFEDWDALVQREGEKEVEAERKRLLAENEEEEMMERVRKTAEEEEREEREEESEWEGIQSEVEEEGLKAKRPRRKTQAERNKIERRKEAERVALREQKMKEKERQVAQAKALAKMVEEKERARAQAVVAAGDDTSSEEGEEVLRRRKFGKIPVPQAPLEVVLADELQESLRLLKPEGNLLKDRFRNILLNGKMEMRRPITQPKKAKRSYTEKWSYKDWKLK